LLIFIGAGKWQTKTIRHSLRTAVIGIKLISGFFIFKTGFKPAELREEYAYVYQGGGNDTTIIRSIFRFLFQSKRTGRYVPSVLAELQQ
jgi:hypothetical protein